MNRPRLTGIAFVLALAVGAFAAEPSLEDLFIARMGESGAATAPAEVP